MIVVQTPLRLSFLGGGTDFDDFYLQHGGAVLSTTIDKSVYVIAKTRFDDMVYVNYSQKEIVKSVDDLQHELVREAMKLTGVDRGIEITTLADVPSEGTGLGSSSAIAVGLLQCLHAYQGHLVTATQLAEEACQIEIGTLKKPIGRQDQYIAAFGDMRFITFGNGGIEPEKIQISPEDKRRLNSRFLLFFTGKTRHSSDVLTEQKANVGERISVLCELKHLALKAKQAILEGAFDDFGVILHQGWELKKELASQISTPDIDEIYQSARDAGALGGKIAGAGGGGFLLLYCPNGNQDRVRRVLNGLRELPFRFQSVGSNIIFDYRGAE